MLGTITVVGQGYVGLPLSIAAAESGYKVWGLDKDSKKVMDLKGENAKLSFSMCIDEISDQDIYTDFMYVPKVLEDIGLFKLSNELSSLSDFFLDKGKNSH